MSSGASIPPSPKRAPPAFRTASSTTSPATGSATARSTLTAPWLQRSIPSPASPCSPLAIRRAREEQPRERWPCPRVCVPRDNRLPGSRPLSATGTPRTAPDRSPRDLPFARPPRTAIRPQREDSSPLRTASAGGFRTAVPAPASTVDASAGASTGRGVVALAPGSLSSLTVGRRGGVCPTSRATAVAGVFTGRLPHRRLRNLRYRRRSRRPRALRRGMSTRNVRAAREPVPRPHPDSRRSQQNPEPVAHHSLQQLRPARPRQQRPT